MLGKSLEQRIFIPCFTIRIKSVLHMPIISSSCNLLCGFFLKASGDVAMEAESQVL